MLVTRREGLRAGVLSAFGLTLADRLRAAPPREKSCILIWLDGGPSHLDTLDPKPDAPVEVRGPFESIATKVPGVRLNENMPRTAALLDKLSILRSMTSPLGEHNLGSHYLLTGYRPTPAVVYPSVGSVLAKLRGAGQALPPYIAVPDATTYAKAGFLPASCQPFEVGGDPAKPDFAVRDVETASGLTTERLQRRRAFREVFDQGTGDPALDQAYQLLLSPKAKQAFDLSREPGKVRQEYGTRSLGQSLLLARRLIEAEVGFVTVTDRGWDTHDRLVNRLKEGFTGGTVGKVPVLDQGIAALVTDLEQRGLLATTMVMVMGEFGRTPRINTVGGRDHWPRVFSVLLAGGGIKGGQVVGKSDGRAESPAERPITPEDLACTVYEAMGIGAKTELQTSEGRPIRVHPGGKVIHELV